MNQIQIQIINININVKLAQISNAKYQINKQLFSYIVFVIFVCLKTCYYIQNKILNQSSDMAFYLQSSDGKRIPLQTSSSSNSHLKTQNNIQEFTIGRIPTNSLQIVDPTVSKNHATIIYYKSENIHVLNDLDSVNGTFVNQEIVKQNMKRKLLHGDKIQFGKHQTVYYYKNSNPQPVKKGKINFKDYHFELEDSQDRENVVNIVPKTKPAPVSLLKQAENNSINIQKHESKLTNHDNQKKKLKETSLNSDFSQKIKFQRPSGRIKIPNIEQFLQFQQQQKDQSQSVKNLPITSSNHLRDKGQNQPYSFKQKLSQSPQAKWQKKQHSQSHLNNKIKLPVLRNQLSPQQKQIIKLNQRKKQIQQAQFNANQQIQQNQRKILQQRLKLQVQKSKNQQKLLNQKIHLQRQLAQQHQKIQEQKFRIEQQIKRKFQQREKLQKRNQLQYSLKQQELLEQLQKEKQKQITELQQKKLQQIKKIQQKQTEQRLLSQKRLKEQLDRKKLQLELQAQALTKQYENIYKETIKKMKRDIEKQQSKIDEVQGQLQKFDNNQKVLLKSIEQKSLERNQLKQTYLNVNSRNKAFLLYASHLQNKIDQLSKSEKQENSLLLSTSLGRAKVSQTHQQLQESISASRKLINMKLRQRKSMQAQIRQMVCEISVLSIDNQHYLDTILQNHEQIQTFKEIYYECMEQEKAIQRKWDAQIQQVSDLDNKCKNSRKDIQNNRKKINDDLLDNIKKLTEQRVHMLKMMHYADQDKKRAAKFLVQEMLNIQQDIRNIKMDSENIHSKITQTIIMSEQKKRQNQRLSQILFGNQNNSSNHHFDNMKDQINRLIELIHTQRQTYSIQTFLKASEQIKLLENKIYEEFIREKHIKQTIKKDGSIPAKSLQRNPLIFFGDVLLKKQLQFDSVQTQQKQIQNNVLQLRAKVQVLQSKKQSLQKLLDKHKIKELQKARKFLL